VLPPDLDLDLLPRPIKAELRGLTTFTAGIVGAHLLMAGTLMDSEPALAFAHADAARRRAARLPVVRQVAGEAAYAAGEYAAALNEFRAVRRMTGTNDFLALAADCERGLERPQAALALVREGLNSNPTPQLHAELIIVQAGARADLDQIDEALRILQAELQRVTAPGPVRARLAYAYADMCELKGDETAALEWFSLAARLDTEGETDAAERVERLCGVVLAVDMDLLEAEALDELGETDDSVDQDEMDEFAAGGAEGDDSEETDSSDTQVEGPAEPVEGEIIDLGVTEPDTSGRTESDDTEDEPEAARTWTAEEDSAGSEWTDRGDQAVDTDSGVVVGSVDLAEELGAPEAEAEAGVAVDPVNQGVDEPGAPAIEEGAPESGEPVDFVDLGGDESRAPAAGAESGVVADSGESGAESLGTSVADAEPSGSVGAGSTREDEGRAEAPTGDQVDDGEPAAADPVGTQPGSTDSDSDDSGSTGSSGAASGDTQPDDDSEEGERDDPEELMLF
jgi:hypothetical protein